MPFYDLHCPTCNKDYNINASVADKTEKRILCPDCGSNNLETIYKPFNIHVKKNVAAGCPNAGACGGCCPHAR